MAAFKNIGAEAGENIHHPHSQILAMSVIPSIVEEYMNKAVDYYKSAILHLNAVNKLLSSSSV